MNSYGNRPTLGGMLLQHIIVVFFCVVFPGGVTLIAPATWLTFERNSEGVRCTTRTCMFFVVPFRIQKVDQVTGIGHREHAGRTERKREFGRTTDKIVQVQGEGFLQIYGEGDEQIEVSVSPASLESIIGKSNDFLASTEQGSTTIFAIANWKFGGLMGGILTLLTVLFVVGYSLGILNWIFMGLRKIFARSESL